MPSDSITFKCFGCGKAAVVRNTAPKHDWLREFPGMVQPPSGWQHQHNILQRRRDGLQRSITYYVCSSRCARNALNMKNEALLRELAWLEAEAPPLASGK